MEKIILADKEILKLKDLKNYLNNNNNIRIKITFDLHNNIVGESFVDIGIN